MKSSSSRVLATLALACVTSVIATSCSNSNVPPGFVGKWERGRSPEVSTERQFVLQLNGDGTGEYAEAEPFFHPRTIYSFHWRQVGNELQLAKINGGKEALTILDKTAGAMTVRSDIISNAAAVTYKRAPEGI